MIIRAILVTTGILLASGCAVTPVVNPDSIVQVNRMLEIPNIKARVYIQNGIEVPKREIDPWEVYCSVLMQKVHARGEPKLTISPGRFEITRVRKYNERLTFPGTFVAMRDTIYFPPVIISSIEMLLNSAEQPDVRALICYKQVEQYIGVYPTLAGIRTTLGNAIEIETP